MADPAAPVLTNHITGQGTVTGPILNTFEQTCDNVGQLRDFTGAPGIQVFLRGYVTPNDGGQGVFFWGSTAVGPDNGSTIIVPTGAMSGAWVRIPLGGANATTGLVFCGDGAGSVISTGVLRPGFCPFACTIASWTLQAEVVGSLVLDVWALPGVNDLLPTVANSICGGNYPTLAGNSQIINGAVTSWSPIIAANTALMINVRSAAIVTKPTLTLNVVRAT